jgi:pilus assembly protein CpaF
MYTVTISERGKPPVKLDFDKPEITIGRVRGNDIVLQKNNVSKRHAKLLIKDGQFIIIDQKSTNGTIVNARKITAPQVVREDDKICVGDFILTLTHHGAAAGERPASAPPAPPAPPPGPAPLGPPPAAPILPDLSDSAPSFGDPAVPSAGPVPDLGNLRPSARHTIGASPGLAFGDGLDEGNVTAPTAARELPPESSGQHLTLAGFGAATPSLVTGARTQQDEAIDELGDAPTPPPFAISSAVPAPAPAPPAAPSFAPVGLAAAPAHTPPVAPLAGPGFGPPPGAVAPAAAPPAAILHAPGPSPSLAPVAPAAVPAPTPAPPSPAAAAPVGPAPRPAVAPSAPGPQAFQRQHPVSGLRAVERAELTTGKRLPEPSEAFARAHTRLVEKVLESTPIASLGHEYPPPPARLAELERSVDRAIDAIAAEGLLAGVDREALMWLVSHELGGLGPIDFYLDQDGVSDIYLNGHRRAFVRTTSGGLQPAHGFGVAATLELAVRRLAHLGASVDPFLTTVYLGDGSRIDAVLPPVAADGPALTVRKVPRSLRSLDALVAAGVLSPNMAAFFRMLVEARRTLVVAGPEGPAKSELLNAIAAAIPERERVIAIEESPLLALPQASALRLLSASAAGAPPDVMRYATRLAPDRILVDGLSPATCYDWVLASAYSTVGSLATVTAHGARDAMARIESQALSATHAHSVRGVREQVARAVEFVAVLSALPGAPMRVSQVVEVQGIELDTIRLEDVFHFQASEAGGGFRATGHVPGFCEELRRSGAEPDLSIFRS